MTAEYATTLELARFLKIEHRVPSPLAGKTERTREDVGTGDGVTLVFYTDNGNILGNSYDFYYGASEGTATAEFTETTHYSLDKDYGKLTLTTTGRTALSTADIFAQYSYTQGISDTELQEALDRAEAYVKKATSNNWSDGTEATPSYQQILDEKHRSFGYYNKDYYSDNYPIANVYTELTSDLAIGSATAEVTSTNGFPSTGYLGIGSNKVVYTGKTSTAFTGCSNVVSAGSSGDKVRSWVVEYSSTEAETEPTWSILEEDDDYDIDHESGNINIFTPDFTQKSGTPNRVRLSYLFGNDSIPDDIRHLVLMLAAKDLMSSAVRKAVMTGINSFNPETINVDDTFIADKISKYKNRKSSNI